MTSPRDDLPGAPYDPDAFQTHNRQGILLAQQGRFDESAVSFREAIRLRPDFVPAYANLGNILTFQGNLEAARACYEGALRMQPREPSVLNNLSNLLRHQEEYEAAAARAREALALVPNYPEAHNNLGAALLMLKRPIEAEASFRQAVALKPDMVEACSNLGEALRQNNHFPEAVAWCRKAVQMRPGFVDACNHLGAALTANGAPEEALGYLHEALRQQPNLVEAHTNLSHALWRLGRFDEAAACCRRALAIKPDFVNAHNILGVIQAKQNQLDEALESYSRALQGKPDFPEAHFHRSLILLLQGNLTEGLREYEWRWKCSGIGVNPLPSPIWDGATFAGRTLMLHIEQGLGDTLQFIRYAPLVKQRGGRVLFSCPSALVPLLRRTPGIDEFAPPQASPPRVDLHASLLSLPYLLGTTLETIPADVPYVFPEEGAVRRWRDELAGLAGFKIGLVWQGNPNHPEDRFRSIPLARFEPMARLPGVHLVSLQVGPGSEQVRALAGAFAIHDPTGKMDPTPGALVDAAAILRNLDLLISCDTSLAHLAGAMNVPVWMAVPFSPDWRWLQDRDDSPWYPSLRLFRAARPAEWGPVIQRMTERLAAHPRKGNPS